MNFYGKIVVRQNSSFCSLSPTWRSASHSTSEILVSAHCIYLNSLLFVTSSIAANWTTASSINKMKEISYLTYFNIFKIWHLFLEFCTSKNYSEVFLSILRPSRNSTRNYSITLEKDHGIILYEFSHAEAEMSNLEVLDQPSYLGLFVARDLFIELFILEFRAFADKWMLVGGCLLFVVSRGVATMETMDIKKQIWTNLNTLSLTDCTILAYA